MCSRWLCVVCVGQLGGECAARGFVLCVCMWDIWGVSVQQLALCFECGTVGGVSVPQVTLCCVCVCVGVVIGGCEYRELYVGCVKNLSLVL